MNEGLFQLLKSIDPNYTEIDFFIFKKEFEKWVDNNINQQD